MSMTINLHNDTNCLVCHPEQKCDCPREQWEPAYYVSIYCGESKEFYFGGYRKCKICGMESTK